MSESYTTSFITFQQRDLSVTVLQIEFYGKCLITITITIILLCSAKPTYPPKTTLTKHKFIGNPTKASCSTLSLKHVFIVKKTSN